MKKVLFIDRDGTLIVEPPEDYQVDSLEKLSFLPKVFQALIKINQELDYTFVMVTNQDGLGTDSFPENTFWPVHNKMMEAFENEGIRFEEVLIDRTFGDNPGPGRKPGTAMLTHYIKGNYDLANSFVLGDRASDIQLANNIGAKGIFIAKDDTSINSDLQQTIALQTTDWMDIYDYLKNIPRQTVVHRQTSETDIRITLNLEGPASGEIQTGLGFFDHMLTQISRHGGFGLNVKVDGDLQIDEHHTIEDTALALGEAFRKALGSKKGINRYAFVLPMDESEAHVSLDFGGRPWLIWEADFKREKVGDVPTEMFHHFFKSFSDAAACNLNIKVTGENEHHKIESTFKAFAKCLGQAVKHGGSNFDIPSSKGVL